MTQHWRELDGLRGVLAMYVVLLHFGISSFAHRLLNWPMMPLGLAVDVFFILSGFVLTHSIRSGFHFPDFVLKRLLRLLPVYYVVTLPTLWIAPSLPGNLWLEAFVAGPFVGRDPVVYPAWSICFELYLPLAAALVPLRIPPRWSGLALGLSVLSLGICGYLVANGASLYALRAVLGLSAGHLLYKLQPQVKLDFGLAGLLVLSAIPLSGFFTPLAAAVAPLACIAIVAGTKRSWLFSLPIVQWFGSISYPVYMVHIPVLYGMLYFAGEAINQNAQAKLAGILLSIVCAYFISRLVERPAMQLSQRLLAKWSRAVGST